MALSGLMVRETCCCLGCELRTACLFFLVAVPCRLPLLHTYGQTYILHAHTHTYIHTRNPQPSTLNPKRPVFSFS